MQYSLLVFGIVVFATTIILWVSYIGVVWVVGVGVVRMGEQAEDGFCD